PNCGLCKLCNREQETGAHIFFKCRFTIRIWKSLIERLGLAHMDTSEWHMHESFYE
uniref:Reverse transcriptase zinc-binding domain-containing protein n=1 Tax=Aegilops tauschii subsp. strangulata TaxID=200361 RepID=A0A453DBM1_AEGTS